MSSETPQNHQETTHQSIEGAIEGAIEEADLFLTFLEEQIKLGGFTAQAKTEIMPSDEQPTP
ncbi:MULTISPECIES: hypothetical protein [Cyanophyceae]|uniref:hypothetical protein n=1 Tax=Cyanophyceae TaxID=3028117 RepID=UPI0016877CBB|nr:MULTISPECIES: hypothetical protein [Cyanophyceae]MBD1914421.1 hypothetical protein [Phormidium sp. FACHB-77]MBD2028864.1 hypothetical protein [Phormidium sp. FACHB-322]MBD2049232.1 hypothetical protein [Leptolyngbya sp. FACHB-60]